jgi:hypothetical protein
MIVYQDTNTTTSGNKILNNTLHCGSSGTGINEPPTTWADTRNNIIYNCFVGIDGIDPAQLPPGQPGYNIIYNATYRYYWSGNANQDSWPVGTGNLLSDPQFRSPGTDYRLQATSPAIDAGAPDTPAGTDFLGTPVPQGLRADMGAYEYPPGGGDTLAPAAPTNLTVQ